MRKTIMSVLVAGVLLGADSHQSQKPSEGKKLWAAISVSTPVRVWLVYSVDVFMIHFALVNDGDKTVDPDVEASQLLINDKEMKEWDHIIHNGIRSTNWTALAPGDYLSFGGSSPEFVGKIAKS